MKNFWNTRISTDWYELYKNQVSFASEDWLEKELWYLKSFDENDVNYIFIQDEIKTKIAIILDELDRRKNREKWTEIETKKL